MDRNRRRQELACGGSERQRAPRCSVTKGCPGETVGSPNLAFSSFGLVPISMIAHENLVRFAVHIDSMGIGQPCRRTLDMAQRFLVLLERSRIDADSVDVLCRDKQFVML